MDIFVAIFYINGQSALQCISFAHSHTTMAAMLGLQGASWGSVSCSRTLGQEEPGIEAPTLSSTEDLPYHLFPNVYKEKICDRNGVKSLASVP